MPSSEEIDYCVEQLGYYVYLEGFCNPDMRPYHWLEDYFWTYPQNNSIVIKESESDGKTYYFDIDDFLSDANYLIDEGIVETFEVYNARQHLWNVYMPKYFEYKKEKEESREKTILYIWWYENGVQCEPELDFPDNVQFEICVDGELKYEWCIDDVSYDEALSLYQRMSTNHSFDDVIFKKIFN